VAYGPGARVGWPLTERLGRRAVDNVDNIEFERIAILGRLVDEVNGDIMHSVLHNFRRFSATDGMHFRHIAKGNLRNAQPLLNFTKFNG